MRKFLVAIAIATLFVGFGAFSSVASAAPPLKPMFSKAAAFDVSKPLRQITPIDRTGFEFGDDDEAEGPEAPVGDTTHTTDGALQSAPATGTIPAPLFTFEGASNTDNFNIFGFRVNPPDTNMDVGRTQVVEMINLVFNVYNKSGGLLLGPVDTGTLWSDFPIPDCTDPSGDPVVLYDQTTDHWILTQFTTRGLDAQVPEYNCVAVSVTGDATGAYYRYAFPTQPDLVDGGFFFPDYPKYGVWSNSYIMTTRDFGWVDRYGISVYALEKNKMVNGNPNARAVQFFLEVPDVVPLEKVGDGLLPPDIDGNRRPAANDSPAPIVGTQDDGAGYGATTDALNIFDLTVHWNANPTATLVEQPELPVAAFDSIYPCGVVPSTTPGVPPTARDCLAQPGITDGSRFLDILSYRQRPTFRLAYRNFGNYESLVTNQAVEARPDVAGERWYEIRRTNGTYSVYQQGTFAPSDGVNRWMGSIAQDQKGNMALGYSVVNGTDVYPGIRYTGRLVGDPLGDMTLGEGVVANGTGVQTSTNSRWGDYTAMTIDPSDDCTFYYSNEYYTAASQATSTAGWLTRIGAFKLPGCKAG
jgi:hypothetical protein